MDTELSAHERGCYRAGRSLILVIRAMAIAITSFLKEEEEEEVVWLIVIVLSVKLLSILA